MFITPCFLGCAVLSAGRPADTRGAQSKPPSPFASALCSCVSQNQMWLLLALVVIILLIIIIVPIAMHAKNNNDSGGD